jgi:hypothetical protein
MSHPGKEPTCDYLKFYQGFVLLPAWEDTLQEMAPSA